MLRTVDLRGQSSCDYRTRVPRAAQDVAGAMTAVAPIIEAVAAEGETALRRFSHQFDHVTPEQLRVPASAIADALNELDPDLQVAIEQAINRRRQVCQAEAGADRVSVDLAAGARVITKQIPVNRVGLYVPGGLAPLASSVLMNVVPAQVAGVASLAVASPPQREFNGLPHPTILAVCGLLGVTEVYAVGGAQAIAMFAHGVDQLCPPVDLVTGPGNIYVVAAKRLLRGVVGIDSEAGPTEIAVLADETANPQHVAADLVSQAEHDPMAGAVVVTDSINLADQLPSAVDEILGRIVEPVPGHLDRIRTALGGSQSGIVLVDGLDQAIAVVNAYGAEHLEIHTKDPARVAEQITNAGAIFIGTWAPVSLGDYCAGSTHVLPTGGTAAHASGLTVHSFCKVVHLIDYDQAALAEVAESVETFATAERLPGHALAVTVRRSPAAGVHQKSSPRDV